MEKITQKQKTKNTPQTNNQKIYRSLDLQFPEY